MLAAFHQVVVLRHVVPFGAIADQFEEPFDRRQGSLQFVAQRAHELQPDFVAFLRQSPRLLASTSRTAAFFRCSAIRRE